MIISCGDTEYRLPLDPPKPDRLLAGAEKQAIELKPVDGKLEAKGSFKVAAGSKVVAAITFGSKTTTARFALK